MTGHIHMHTHIIVYVISLLLCRYLHRQLIIRKYTWYKTNITLIPAGVCIIPVLNTFICVIFGIMYVLIPIYKWLIKTKVWNWLLNKDLSSDQNNDFES